VDVESVLVDVLPPALELAGDHGRDRVERHPRQTGEPRQGEEGGRGPP
jgi:hypothetical protein